jgi:hypothetical protein
MMMLCEHYDVTLTESWNTHDRDVNFYLAYWPDITIKNKEDKIHIALDVAIPVDRNSTQNEAEKKLKYKGLCTEISL